MSRMEVNFKENKEVWDNFVLNSPHRSIFVYSKFLDSLQADYDLVTCYEKEKIVAGSVIIYSESGTPINSVYPFTQYQGLLLADNKNQSIHSQITHDVKVVACFVQQLADHYRHCCLCQSWRFRDMRPFQWHNYHEPHRGLFDIDLRYTGILDLRKYIGFKDYFHSIRSVRRQEFKKSSKLLTIKMINDEILLDDLHTKTLERQGINKGPQQSLLVRSIVKHSLVHNYGSLQCALLNDTPISAVLFLYDDRSAYYLFGANDPEHRNLCAGSLLLSQMIGDALSRKLQEVDFVGVNSPNRGDYKISFNAELKPFFVTSFGC